LERENKRHNEHLFHNLKEFKGRVNYIPKWWPDTQPRDRIGLREKRREKRLPDISFDLDNDGVVSECDYYYAKRFDKDKDGKLNAEEYKKALSTLKGAYDARKFTNLKQIFLTRNKPTVGLRSLSELKQRRKEDVLFAL